MSDSIQFGRPKEPRFQFLCTWERGSPRGAWIERSEFAPTSLVCAHRATVFSRSFWTTLSNDWISPEILHTTKSKCNLFIHGAPKSSLGTRLKVTGIPAKPTIKGSAFFCYCASRGGPWNLGFLRMVPTNTKRIFAWIWLCEKSRSIQGLVESKIGNLDFLFRATHELKATIFWQ